MSIDVGLRGPKGERGGDAVPVDETSYAYFVLYICMVGKVLRHFLEMDGYGVPRDD